ncbi:unnamed protein product [Hymenolepis diminuta]|uniref:Uncharacterized protein n=1 Tax=Hymenolepis diminuta TaxID=6216 RepID=A0A3P6ZN47_HYMDI|nr:unnamed protein product [Hymenolepis diminuta]
MKTYQWPISIVPMTESQIEAEYEATVAVDVEEALKACASEAIAPSTFKGGDGDSIQKGSEIKKFQLPKISEIKDLREFKNRVLFSN